MAREATTAAKCMAEFLGTFLLIFTVGCSAHSGNAAWGGVFIGSVLMVAIYSLGGISGANFNPAVSLALGLTKAMKTGEGVTDEMKKAGLEWSTVGLYTVVQVLAGVAAGFSYSTVFEDSSFTLGPADGFVAWQAGLCEFLYTFMLCFVVLNVAIATESGNSPNEFFGLAIGYVIVAGAYGAGAVSGGCFNPAVAIGIDASSLFKGGGWSMLYVLCELCGGAAAALAFRVVRAQEFGGERLGVADWVSEFLGTFFLVLTVGLNVLGNSPAGAFSIAASLMCMIYALGNVSGGHFNPAVTVAIFASRRQADSTALGNVLPYVAVQLLGGILGAFTYVQIRNGDSFPVGPGENYGWGAVAVAEITFTFLLCYVVLSVAVSETTKSKTMFGLAIGSCVTVGGNAIGAISGGHLNPAVSLGAATWGGGLSAALAYTGFQLAGGVLAACVFTVTHAVDGESDDSCDYAEM